MPVGLKAGKEDSWLDCLRGAIPAPTWQRLDEQAPHREVGCTAHPPPVKTWLLPVICSASPSAASPPPTGQKKVFDRNPHRTKKAPPTGWARRLKC